MKRTWIGCDFDGTLATTKDGKQIGEPIPRMVNRVQRWLDKGREVRIVTARVSEELPPRERKANEKAIRDWCWKHLGTEMDVQAEKSPGMRDLWDDRVHRVVRNTGRRLPRKRKSIP